MFVSNTEAGHARRTGKGKRAPAILRRGIGAHSPAGVGTATRVDRLRRGTGATSLTLLSLYRKPTKQAADWDASRTREPGTFGNADSAV